jgi:hypothetical protein
MKLKQQIKTFSMVFKYIKQQKKNLRNFEDQWLHVYLKFWITMKNENGTTHIGIREQLLTTYNMLLESENNSGTLISIESRILGFKKTCTVTY